MKKIIFCFVMLLVLIITSCDNKTTVSEPKIEEFFIKTLPKKLEYEIKPIIGKYVKQHEVLYNAFYSAFSDFTNESVKVNGRKNILMQPEFNDADKIRDIISKFEDKEIVKSIKEEENGINIYIGSENNFDDDVTVIKTKYRVNGEEGTIALIGPKRMEYERVITLLNYILEWKELYVLDFILW